MRTARFTNKEKWIILLITLLGAFARFYFHFERDFLGDEIGTLKWIEKDIPYLLSHFEVWLTMNYFIIVEKIVLSVFNGNRLSLLIIPLFAGVFTIPFTAVLAKRYIGATGAILAAIFVAFNPYLIRYSGIIRSYSLMTLFSLIVIILFNKWNDNKTTRNGVLLSLFSYLLILIHPNGIYVIVCIAIFSLFQLIICRFNILVIRKYLTLAIPLSIALLLVYFSYISILPEMLREGEMWHAIPPVGVDYLNDAINVFFAEGFLGWISLGFILFGFYKAVSNHSKIVHLFAFLFIPMVLISLQGLDHYPWAFARMLIFTLPLYLIFIAYGVIQLVKTFSANLKAYSILILSAIIVLSWFPNYLKYQEKNASAYWKDASSELKENFKSKKTLVIASNYITKLHLSQYITSEVSTLNKSMLTKNQQDEIIDVYFIYIADEIISARDYKQFGHIKIIRYADITLTQGLELLKKDLVQTTINFDVNPEFTDFYHNLIKLNEILGESEHSMKYIELHLKSQQLTRRHLYMPVLRKQNMLETSRLSTDGL